MKKNIIRTGIVIHVIILFLSSCKKEKPETNNDYPQQLITGTGDTINDHAIAASWNSSFQYSLSFFTLNFSFNADSTGDVHAIYNETGTGYPTGTVAWQKFDSDSVQIYFEFDAYPAEGWLLKGIISDNDSTITGQNYQVLRTDHSEMNAHGDFIMTRE